MLTVKDKNFDWANAPLAALCDGCAKDTYFTRAIYEVLKKEVNNGKQAKLFEYLINPLLVRFAKMEYNGILIDTDCLETLDKELTEKVKDLELVLRKFDCVSEDDNLASSDDLGKIIFLDDGGFGIMPPDWTKGGKPSTNKDTITIILELLDDELEARAT